MTTTDTGPQPDPTPVAGEPQTMRGVIAHRILDLIEQYGDNALAEISPDHLAEWIAEYPTPIEAEARRLTAERLREAGALLADAQPNGMAMSPVEWRERQQNLIAALAHPEEEQSGE